MRYAIVSDIHANIQAWKAVLSDIQKQGVDAILCLGDVIGYGPNPVEVLESCHKHVDYFVLGNHDAVVGDRMDSSLFNDSAKYLIEWTRNQLSSEAAKFFADMPLRMEGETFACAHAELALPGRFSYLYEPNDCISSFDATRQQILFVGHTHMQTKFTWSAGRLLQGKNTDFNLKEGDRYLVNAGSVGDPRDGKTNAQYIIYDEVKKSMQYRSIPFDIQSFKINLAKAKLPVTPFFVMIDEGQRKEAETIKDMEVMSDNQVSSSDTEITFFDKEEMLETRTRRLTRSINFSPETMKKIHTHKKKREESRTKAFEEQKKKSNSLLISIIILLVLVSGLAFYLLKSKTAPNISTEENLSIIQNTNEDTAADVKKVASSKEAYDGYMIGEESSEPKIWAGNWLKKESGSFSSADKDLRPEKYPKDSSIQISQNCLAVKGKVFMTRNLDISENGLFNQMDILRRNTFLVKDKSQVYLSFILKVEKNHGFEVGFGKRNRKAKSSYWSLTVKEDDKNLFFRSGPNFYKISAFDNKAHFIVIKIDQQSENDQISLYIDPHLSKEPPLATFKSANPGNLLFNSMVITAEEMSELYIDEFRVGLTYDSVTP